MKRISGIILILCAVLIYSPRYVSAQSSGGEVFRQEGIASWYGTEFDGRPTASGEIFNSSLFTAAHPTLPFGTLLNVTNKHNNKSVTVKVNDRGPFVSARIIDISRAAAEELDMITTGTAPVIIRTIDTVITPGSAAHESDTLWNAPPETPPPPAPAAVVAPPPPPAAPPPPPPAQRVEMYPADPRPPAPVTPAAVPQYTAPPAAPVQAAQPPAAQPLRYNRAVLVPNITLSPQRKYRLQVGSYKVARNAMESFDRLKNAGLNPKYEQYEDFYRVVLAGIPGDEVDTITLILGSVGFREVLIREER